MAKLTTAEFIDAIKELSVLELNDLVKACEEEFGVSAAAGVVVAAAGAGAAASCRAARGKAGGIWRADPRTGCRWRPGENRCGARLFRACAGRRRRLRAPRILEGC